ncbi:c-type cytochrome biogenesis protein CcmI [Roseospira visakhapatnamensis]|uniref:Cytochrome c-type biogenesis protein CcmH n=1 Tax=Roseospira visakhapatnamensis TaxID=390880 RepID=A0A7W6RFT1_9PROT|nr:c-type cytochrome biogenesis protein CcmI [Roseospira visakhapatnamensis]MBB4267211.1 cytochrome c-type biogenesis protein CcmH [Roseospira visakhapatnamensis]
MILLWLLVILLTLMVLALLVWPLLRHGGQAAPDRASYDLTVYRDQLGEIDRDVARGLLSPDQAESARLEIQRRMLGAAGSGAAGDVAPSVAPTTVPALTLSRPASLIGIGILLPLGALAVYLMLGSPGLPGQPHAERIAREEQRLMASLPAAVRDRIASLSEAVEADPDDVGLWLQLGRVHRVAEQHDKAVEALERARALGPVGAEKAAVLAELAESLIMTHDGAITERIRALFVETLRAAPGDPRARFYLGVAAVQAGDPVKAIAIWRDLAMTSAADASWMPMLRQNMGMVAEENGIAPASVTPLHPLRIEAGEAVTRRDVPAPGEEEEEGAAAPASDRPRAGADAARAPGQGLSADDRAMIEGMVEGLAARLEDDPDDAEGWQRLARSYRVMGRLDEAAEAMGRAAALRPDDVAVLLAHADALIAAARAKGATEPPEAVYDVFEAVLKQQPDNPNALYFVGRAAAESGAFDRARELWSRLLALIPPDEPAHASVRQQRDALPRADAPAGAETEEP